jgi:hypothetical protein
MISLRNGSMTFLTAVLLLGPTIWASEPNGTAAPLRFAVSSTPIRISQPWDILAGPQPPRTALGIWKPPYAIGIPLDGPTTFLPLVDHHDGNSFRAYAERSGRLSQRQKEFLEATRWVFESQNPLTFYRPTDPNQPREFLLYAMTLEDAKGLARICVDYAVGGFESWSEDCENRLKEGEAITAALEKRMRELEAAVQGAGASVTEIQKKIAYRTRQEAMEAIAELDRMRNAAQVDIAGIRAKIAAIQKWQSEYPGPVVLEQLKAMFVEESISLEAAEARRAMATQLRGDANTFVDARQILDNASEEKERLSGEMATNKENVASQRKGLEGSRKLRPCIGDRPITIHPVEWGMINSNG